MQAFDGLGKAMDNQSCEGGAVHSTWLRKLACGRPVQRN